MAESDQAIHDIVAQLVADPQRAQAQSTMGDTMALPVPALQEHNGKFYSVPTVWDGRREVQPFTRQDGSTMDVPNPTALANVAKAGWDSFPAYATPEEADSRYGQMHGYMERDTADYMKQRGQ